MHARQTMATSLSWVGWRRGGTSSGGGGDQLAPRLRIRQPPVDSTVDDGFGVVLPCEQDLGP